MVDQATGVGRRQSFPGQPLPPLAPKQSEDDRVLGFPSASLARRRTGQEAHHLRVPEQLEDRPRVSVGQRPEPETACSIEDRKILAERISIHGSRHKRSRRRGASDGEVPEGATR
jgi:hypothetical protein